MSTSVEAALLIEGDLVIWLAPLSDGWSWVLALALPGGGRSSE